MAGVLYIVATPIGNLEDITYRAVRILGEVSRVACEDTRQTRKLMDHFGIRTPLVSYHEHNEAARARELIREIESGASVALVSDAGTPLVSDPGYRLVEAAVAAGIAVVPIPGPVAAVAALSASGIASTEFLFAGFLPPKSGARRKTLESLRTVACTLVFYETPHRILEALADIEDILGPRRMVAAREITKMHEEFLRGTPAGIRESLDSRPGGVKGEFTLIVGPPEGGAESGVPVEEAVRTLEASGMPKMDAIKEVARERGLNKRDVYRAVTER